MTDVQRRDVVVVGAGISGLVAAWRLHCAGMKVALIEANDQVGGCIQTELRDGFVLEKGPFNVLVRDDAFHDLLQACKSEVAPIRAADAANARYLFKDGALHKVPMGMLALWGSPLLSFGAKLRVMMGMFFSARARQKEPTIHEAAERRLGREIADVFISSIVAGVFGGDSRKLSIKACFPKAYSFDQERRCPLLYEIKVLRAKKKMLEQHPERRAQKGLVSFNEGLQGLCNWLARQLDPNVYTSCRVDRVERDKSGYVLHCQHDQGERLFACDHLVLATPHAATADLVRPLAAPAADQLEQIESASLVVLNLAYRREDVGHPMSGYGFLVPMTETTLPVMGVLWADSAFPHHAPEDQRLIRVFMGGPRDPGAAKRDEADLLATATKAIAPLLGITGDPTLVDICRWQSSIPQYHVGHTDRIAKLDEALGDLSNLHLIGSYIHGVSINDCVRESTDFVDRLVAEIQSESRTRDSEQGDVASSAA